MQPKQDPRRAALIYKIYQTAKSLEVDELRIIQMVSERLDFGQKKYNCFVLDSDVRDFVKEYSEEALDGVVYSACAAMKAENAAERAVAGKLLEIALCGVQESTRDAIAKPAVKPSLSDRLYFALLGKEVPFMLSLFVAILLVWTVVAIVRG